MDTTQQIIDTIKTNLAPLAEVAKEAGGYGWELLVKKAFWIDGIATLIAIIASVIVFSIVFKKSFKYGKKEGLLDEPYLILPVFAGIALAIAIIALLGNMPSILTALILPEYKAIQDVLYIVK